MKDLQPIFSKVKELESKRASPDVVDFLEKLEACVASDIH
jgi:hypothetical protein